MKSINFDILSKPGEFELILIPCSCYQKKGGEMPVMKGGLLEEIVSRCPSLPTQIGKAVEQYGNCPAILSHIPGTKHPTKFATFPISPTSLRAENPDDYIFHRLKGRFPKYKLLPGWTLLPRSDMLEFAAIKLAEIIKYYKLTMVALPFELFTLDPEDKKETERILGIIGRIVTEGLYIVHRPEESSQGTVRNNIVTSQVYYEEGETDA